jgi:Flp pilus assembly protein TadG
MSRRRRFGSEEGSVATFFVIITIAVLAATGLVVDGGRKMAALGEARDIADNAARACAQQISVGSVRRGSVVLDRSSAVTAGSEFLALTGHQGSVEVSTVDPLVCTVEVRIRVPTLLLPGPYQVAATQSARGISQP